MVAREALRQIAPWSKVTTEQSLPLGAMNSRYRDACLQRTAHVLPRSYSGGKKTSKAPLGKARPHMQGCRQCTVKTRARGSRLQHALGSRKPFCPLHSYRLPSFTSVHRDSTTGSCPGRHSSQNLQENSQESTTRQPVVCIHRPTDHKE